jgi:multiple sugar transport system ATP-binding protein
VRLEDLRRQFGEFVAVAGSTFEVADGEFFVMLGPSGCGKTTTLRIIAGLERPTSGRILLDGEDVTSMRASRRDIALMFQLFALYPHMSVRENIAFPLKCRRVPRTERERRVQETASLLRIEHLLSRRVAGLAGGDRQRVALGRAIVREPRAFLMDEPLGALDAEFRHLMCGELRTLHDRLGATTIYVTHDQLEAMAIADRVMIMNRGTIEQLDTPQAIYGRPASMFVADFVGSPPMSFLRFDGPVEPGQSTVGIGGALVEIPTLREGRSEGPLALGIRPEHVRFTDDGRLRGHIFATEYMGTTQIVTVDTRHGQLKARLPSRERVATGENVGIDCRPERLVVFDARTGRALRSDLYEAAAHG